MAIAHAPRKKSDGETRKSLGACQLETVSFVRDCVSRLALGDALMCVGNGLQYAHARENLVQLFIACAKENDHCAFRSWTT